MMHDSQKKGIGENFALVFPECSGEKIQCSDVLYANICIKPSQYVY
jgi:hypothetical protein